MFDWMGEMYDAVVDEAHGPVDPTQGTQGGSIGHESDGSFLGDAGQWLGDLGRGLSNEGLGGVFDPVGMMDRAAAQRELASQFNIIDDDVVGTREANQVTPEEYEQIARTYSDIRLGRSDIELNTEGMDEDEAAQFRGETMGDIGNLMQTESGRRLVNGLAYQPDDHTTTLNLRTDADGNRDNSNATGGAAEGAVPGSWADGHGTNAQVTYVPGDEGGIVAPQFNDDWLPMRSDITLFHEMTHAYHAAYGTLDQTALDATHGEDEGIAGLEHQAVGLGDFSDSNMSENAYRAERRRIGALGVGERTTGGVADDDVAHRGTYVPHEDEHDHGP